MSVNAKMTAIADEIRILSGTEDTMGLDAMATNISNANDEVVTQTNLINQIAGILEGKATGGGNTDIEDALITRTFSTYTNDRVKSVGSYAFYGHSSLTTVSFPLATSIGNSAFTYCSSLATASFSLVTSIGTNAFCSCTSLTTASFPLVTSIGTSAFYNCTSLTTVNFPLVTSIGTSAFYNCNRLTTASFPVCANINNGAFSRCRLLTSLYLTGSSLCKLSHSNVFALTPIGGNSASAGTYGCIYVPASLLTSYQTATNWTYFSSRFVGI